MRLLGIHGIVPQCKLKKKTCVTEYHFYSLLVNFCILLNLVLMPLKAYLNEELPFVKYRSLPKLTSNSTNYEIYRNEILTQMQRHYNKHTLPNQAFYIDEERGIYITRGVVNIPHGKKIKRRSFAYGLPGCAFYPSKLNDKMLEFGAGMRNISNVNDVFLFHDFSVPSVLFAVWIVPGNELNVEVGFGDAYTIYASNYRLQRSNQWTLFKFLYRLLTSSYIVYILWRKYFSQVVWLKKKLATNSLPFKSEFDQISRYVIAIGDPTNLILADPVVAIAFMLEIRFSLDVIVEAVMSVMQDSSLRYFLFGSFYLSRMLWFPYGGLRLLAFVLKKLNAENSFNSCDPMLVAITTSFIVGPFTRVQANSVLCEIYQYTFSIKFPSSSAIPGTESTVPILFWTSTLIAIPIAYGFVSSKVEAVRKRKKLSEFGQSDELIKRRCLNALIESNSHKNRFLLWFIGLTNIRKHICIGGSIHTLFQLDKKYSRIPTFDHRGSDCFILCYKQKSLICRLRVTSCLCIDYSKLDTINGKTIAVHNITESELKEQTIHPLPKDCKWIA